MIDFPIAMEMRVQDRYESQELFRDRQNGDLVWEGLLWAGKNQKERAAAIGEMIRAGAVGGPFAWRQARPENIDDFFDRIFITGLFRDPDALTALGLLESIGVREHNAYLTDFSLASIQREIREAKEQAKALKTYSIDTLSFDRQISVQMLSWVLDFKLKSEPFIMHSYPVNQMHGVVQNLTALFLLFQPLSKPEDGMNYVLRLKQIPVRMKQTIDWMEKQRQKGIVPPHFTVEKSIGMVQKFLGQEENLFYSHLKSRDYPEEVLALAKETVAKQVIPAYRDLLKFLEKLLGEAKENRGVWSLPNGDAYYRHMLRYHTTTDLTPEKIHELGLREVSRIEKEMKEIFAAEGMEGDVGELLKKLGADKRFYYPNTEEGKASCLADFEAILVRCREKLWPLFDLKPRVPVLVRPIPAHEQEGAPGAYYYMPNGDGSRPGVFYVNMADMGSIPKFGMETLAVHEAEPGHHFQLSLQIGMDLPLVRKFGDHYTAYIEGWALYAEKLAYEEGFYSSSFDRLGHLQGEMMRAVRLVVDTGIHKMRWSREQALDYFMKKTGMDLDASVSEIERYFVMPGQACAYKIGQLKILELRARAKQQLGDRFDIREFHNQVLKIGAVPLSVLEECINQYIYH